MRTTAPEEVLARDQPILAAGTRLGAWRIERFLGGGAMGAVYRAARDDGLYDQTVAIKVLKATDPRQVERFERERHRLARMDHPGVSRIIDGGTAGDGRPFMVMEYVEGRPIDEAARQGRLSRREIIGWFEALCSAVSHAHGKLVLHRDIKPDNVLVDNENRPRLIDFGIASAVGADDDEAGGRALTVPFAAPELFRSEPLSVTTDIFALGALLHTLLAGHPPEREADGGVSVDREAIRDGDLIAIIARATCLDPAKRYASAALLSADLKAWCGNYPVAARRGGWAYAASKFLRRYPMASGFAAAAVLALVGGVAVSLDLAAGAQAEARRARDALADAEFQRAQAEAFLQGQTAYNDLLLAAFGGDNAEAMTQTLLKRWREVHDAHETNEREAAAMSFALGRNMYLRGDRATAEEVFSAWLEEGYGPENLRFAGGHIRALNLYDWGSYDEALVLFREELAREEAGFRQSTADRLNVAFRMAILTTKEEDKARARDLYATYLREVEGLPLDPSEAILLHSFAYQLRRLDGDRDGAMAAIESIIGVCDGNPGDSISVCANARAHLAKHLLYTVGDADAAERIIRGMLAEDFAEAGESIITAHALMMLGEILRLHGRTGEALEAMDRARELNRTYSGSDALGTYAENFIRARVLVDHGEVARAEDLLDRLEQRWYAEDAENAEARPPATFRLMRLWLLARTGALPRELEARARAELSPEDVEDEAALWLYRDAVSAGLPDILGRA